jgi:hypothetical protein
LTAVGDINANADVTVLGSLHLLSDGKYKTNRVPATNLLAELRKIKTYTFDFKYPNAKSKSQRKYGIIADEIEKLGAPFNTFIKKLPNGDKVVEYDKFGVAAVGAIVELDAKVTALEARLKAIEAKVTN